MPASWYLSGGSLDQPIRPGTMQEVTHAFIQHLLKENYAVPQEGPGRTGAQPAVRHHVRHGVRGSLVVCSALHGALIIQIASNRLLGCCPHPSFPAESLLAVKMILFGV